MDEATRKQIERGKRLTELLKQGTLEPVSMSKQVAVLYAGVNGYVDSIEVDALARWKKEFLGYLDREWLSMLAALEQEKGLTEDLEDKMKQSLENFSKIWKP